MSFEYQPAGLPNGDASERIRAGLSFQGVIDGVPGAGNLRLDVAQQSPGAIDGRLELDLRSDRLRGLESVAATGVPLRLPFDFTYGLAVRGSTTFRRNSRRSLVPDPRHRLQ